MMKHGSDTNKMFRELNISKHSSFHMYLVIMEDVVLYFQNIIL